MHRSDPYASSFPRRRGRRDSLPRDGPADSLLQLAPRPRPPRPPPRRTRVTIRDIPRPPRRPGIWIGNHHVTGLDLITAAFGIAVLLAIFWPH